ncbi:ATP-dependent DNA helicase RecG [Jezberella montanilacus]|uniref:ATP-dependent DNA helicase RecG n=1 Tax=Jezberella montanilacus TaxID=323426 RepID=A0A2T0XJ65_9BURK|nr:ATP-dependent DNA helicase RecG [Jezberella montanilacus]PRY98988.1 ATP-dependent DNA helicase RecG [Jezberella montanilacus]
MVTRTAASKSKKTIVSGGSLTAQKFEKLGLRTPEDFVLHLPLRYEDETRISSIADLRPNMNAQIEISVVRSDVMLKPRRQLTAVVEDDTGTLNLRWLTFYPSQHQQMQPGKRWRIRGEVRAGYHGLEIIHPRLTVVGSPLPAVLTPVYPSTEGLTQPTIRKTITQALSQVNIADTLPNDLVTRLQLMPFAEAIAVLHSPKPDDDETALLEHTHPAWMRVKFDELLAQQLSLAAARDARRSKRAPSLPKLFESTQSLTQKLKQSLPFELTQSQNTVIAEISEDLGKTYPMYRLLQGDVGSGKTIVATMAALQAIENGVQVAVMAPTEILAEQHFQKMKVWCEPLGVSICWLTGSLSPKAKREATLRIQSGEARLIVGTQALIQETVEFENLGLAIVDEQHRFGVNQRLLLSRKGEGLTKDQLDLVPHQLAMSATPIPRTLAMTFFADLEVSSIIGLPPGRSPIVTKLLSAARRDEVIQHIANAATSGQQTYWVCPLIEESETLELETAVDTQASLSEALTGITVGLVHGRLSSAEKAAVMRDFRDGVIQVLVATTVIEVGVDVPTASLMVIEHAERFGLAQLHQLRGRVGRGQSKSVCVLLYQAPLSELARSRLRAMFESQDGFEIAQRDLDLRGPGELLGARQSGVALLRFADLAEDGGLVSVARDVAQELRKTSPQVVEQHLHRWMRGREDFLRS